MKCTLVFFFLSIIGQTHAAEISLKDYLALPANPMKITVTLASEKVTKKIKASTGGNISLVAKNGDRFELILPANSLPSDTEISLQEVKSVKHKNLKTSAQYSTVEISPDGINLQVPATLIFKPKNSFPTNTLTPFSAQADGDETHLAILSGNQTPNEIKVSLLHFSNYTISNDPSAAEIIDQGLSRMENTRISNWLTRKILESKRTNGDIAKDLDQAFRESFNNAVLPSILRVNSCSSGSSALENFVVWHRQILLVGGNPESYFPEGFDIDLGSMLNDTSEQCFELAKKACYIDHRPIEVMKYALQYIRIGQLLGSPAIVERFSNLAEKCSKFKFFMESEFWMGADRQNYGGVTAKADFDFSLSPFSNELIKGSINVVRTDLNFEELNCEQIFFETKPSEVLMTNFLLLGNTDDNAFTIGIGGLIPYSFANYRCVDKTDPEIVMEIGVPGVPMGSYWGGAFIGAHGPTGTNELDLKTGFFNIKGWEVRHDTRYASKEYTQTIEDSLNETTTMVIYHTPEPL